MDYIKISLIGLIAVIAYYLLLQWPPSSIDSPTNPIISQENSVAPQDLAETISINDSIYVDSEPSLTGKETLISAPDDSTSSNSWNEPSKQVEITPSRIFSLNSDVLNIEIDAVTGKFIKAGMKDIKVEKGADESMSLFGRRSIDSEDGCPIRLGLVQNGYGCVGNYFASSGFIADDKIVDPNFKLMEKLTMGDKGILYILSGENSDMLFTRKVWLRPGDYFLDVEDLVRLKGGSEPTTAVPYARIVRDGYRPPGRFLDFDSYTYLGPVFSTEYDSFGKLDFNDLQEESFESQSSEGWLAVVQRYFVSSWVPEQGKIIKYQARKMATTGAFSMALTGQRMPISDGTLTSFKNSLYVGPKIADNLILERDLGLKVDLGLVVDYGFLWWLSTPIHTLMTWGYVLLGNWGLAILFATLVLKAVLWPLSAAGYRSAAKMRAVAPQMAELQQKHANDKQKLGQEMMAFYKKEGVSPLGGCLPMLLQMPFFLAFYWVLLDMVELRHAPFLLWITDLSSYDPFFVLPLLNAGLMYYSQKMMPVTPSSDPTQQQMQSAMKFMPIMIAAMFCIFPAGFVLYFTIQSLITVIQQALSFRKAGISLKSV